MEWDRFQRERSRVTRSRDVGSGGQKMEVGQFQFHRRASAALNELSPADQTKVLGQLSALESIPRPTGPPAW